MIVIAFAAFHMALTRGGRTAVEETELRRDLVSCLAVAVLLRLTVRSVSRVRP